MECHDVRHFIHSDGSIEADFNDQVELLSEAVEYFLAEPSKSARKRKPFRKLPWKKISQWMKDNGSSYLFAPATCARKWEEI